MARRLKANGNGTDTTEKKRGKKDEPIRSNLTDATIQEHYQKVLAAKHDQEEAAKAQKEKNAIYRAALKDAKKVGIDPADIIWRLNMRHRSPEEIDAETKRRNRIAKLTNLPIGTQLGLELDGTTIATAIENAASPDTDEAAHQAGYDAAHAGKGITTNPYPLESSQFDAFEKGWGKQQSERALSMGQPAGAAAH